MWLPGLCARLLRQPATREDARGCPAAQGRARGARQRRSRPLQARSVTKRTHIWTWGSRRSPAAQSTSPSTRRDETHPSIGMFVWCAVCWRVCWQRKPFPPWYSHRGCSREVCVGSGRAGAVEGRCSGPPRGTVRSDMRARNTSDGASSNSSEGVKLNLKGVCKHHVIYFTRGPITVLAITYKP